MILEVDATQPVIGGVADALSQQMSEEEWEEWLRTFRLPDTEATWPDSDGRPWTMPSDEGGGGGWGEGAPGPVMGGIGGEAWVMPPSTSGNLPAWAPPAAGLSGFGTGTPRVTVSAAPQPASAQYMDRAATRIFAGPDQFPPEDFAAYAIIAFKSRPLESETPRHLMICEAYRTSIADASAAFVPRHQQLVTVWPVRSREVAAAIARLPEDETCSPAVQNYGLVTAQLAIGHARMTDTELVEYFAQRRGPFLLAWSPAQTKGQEDALILRMDLSDVEFEYQARRRMEFWVQQIEQHPERWLDGWQRTSIWNAIGEAADIIGTGIIAFFGRGSG